MSELPLEISCSAAQRMVADRDDVLLVDCRERDEHALVAIDGATLLPTSEIVSRAEELSAHRELPIVVFCHHGGRSAQVATWLRRQGYDQVQSMAGGIDQWAVEIAPGMARY